MLLSCDLSIFVSYNVLVPCPPSFLRYSFSVVPGGGARPGGITHNSTPSTQTPPTYGGDLLASPVSPTAPPAPPSGSGGRRARVLYDYDAAGMNELSLLADEVGTIHSKATSRKNPSKPN